MRFYTGQHRFYCGVDLHARTMYLCILDAVGQVVYDRNLPTTRQAFLQAVAPFRDGLVVAVECLFCWYWLADLCAKEKIAFVLGHALYMKAIHGGKSKRHHASRPAGYERWTGRCATSVVPAVRGQAYPIHRQD